MIKLKLIPIEENKDPYYHIIFNYMIGDGNGNTTYDFTCSPEDIDEVIKYVSILKKLKPLKRHWGICFDNYSEEYPGDYIGLSEEEYKTFLHLLELEEEESTDIEFNICDCIKSRINEWSFLVFEGIEIYYYDKNNRKYQVVIEEEN